MITNEDAMLINLNDFWWGVLQFIAYACSICFCTVASLALLSRPVVARKRRAHRRLVHSTVKFRCIGRTGRVGATAWKGKARGWNYFKPNGFVFAHSPHAGTADLLIGSSFGASTSGHSTTTPKNWTRKWPVNLQMLNFFSMEPSLFTVRAK
jgi:hypothetical protein